MNHLDQQPRTLLQRPWTVDTTQPPASSLPTWRLNLMRVGYFVMVAGLAVTK